LLASIYSPPPFQAKSWRANSLQSFVANLSPAPQVFGQYGDEFAAASRFLEVPTPDQAIVFVRGIEPSRAELFTTYAANLVKKFAAGTDVEK
jgi:hypothetical protein